MDLTKVQFEQLKGFIDKWMKDEKLELETTFGIGNEPNERVQYVVDSNTFLQIAKRLRSKGFESIAQNDRLSIITPIHIRFSLEGMGVLQDYCRDDVLQGKPFTAMIKDRAIESRDLDIDEYNMRIKVRREEEVGETDPQVQELLRTWGKQKKAFRLLRRWSFKGNGVRMDLSMVRQSPIAPGGREYQWSSTFQERNVLNEVPRYEVEVELLHGVKGYTDTADKALKCLIAGCGEVLRAIQKNSLLIPKSVANSVRREYQAITGAKKFRGVGPMTLQVDNIRTVHVDGIPNIRSGYNVTDKADGLRTMGFVNEHGDLYLVDQSLNIYRTGLKNDKCAKSIVDGEWVTLSKDGQAINHYLIFDIYHYIDGKKVSHLPFITFKEGVLDNEAESRYNMMSNWYKTWKDGVEPSAPPKVVTLLVALKGFMFATAGDSIFQQGCASILDSSRLYHTDGLILTSNSAPIPDNAGVRFPQQFKWKPSKDNTVDFLINYERNVDTPALDKITTGIQKDTNNAVQYKTMRLYVGSKKGKIYDDPRATILFQQQIVYETESDQYKPALFHPIEFPDTMANTCYVRVQMDHETREEYTMTEDTEEPISNRSVVEMRYDPSREAGWRWIPSRIRHDKTERLLRAASKAQAQGIAIKYSGIMNDEGVANDVWNSIHNPVTESMIRNGTEQATDAEIQTILKIRESESEIGMKYYERTAPNENMILVKGLRDFHNRYIKNDILIKSALRGGSKTLVDLACGKGGDLRKWIDNRARTVVGIDTSGDGITNSSDGAYKRYMQEIIKLGIKNVPKVAFIIGNSSKNIVTGDAGANSGESDMLRSIFGKYDPIADIPPYIETVMAGSFRDGADVAACMFALHYFFKNKEMLDGFLRNLSDIVKIGGYFIGCCFDGNKVFNLLRRVERGKSKSGMIEDVPLWTITKDYDADELPNDESSLGLGIDVEFISIGSAQKEYLVSFDFLTTMMKSIGFSLLNASELKEMNLSASTNTFDVSYLMAERNKKKYSMEKPVMEYSFLNRWFIFKRRGVVEISEIPVEEVAEVATAATGPAATTATERSAIKSVMTKPTVTSASASASASMPPIQLQEFDEKEEPVASVRGSLPDANRIFQSAEIARFGLDVIPTDVLGGKNDMNMGRWMSLAGRFPIPDSQDPTIVYPTIEHFLAGMKLKFASDKPELARDLMSSEGSIHRSFRNKRLVGVDPESGNDFKLLEEEITMVRKTISTKSNLSRYRITIYEHKWDSIKDNVLMEALRYRFANDVRFIKGVTTARSLGKYLLYTKTAGSELGGTYASSKKIVGENKVGRFIMELANFNFQSK